LDRLYGTGSLIRVSDDVDVATQFDEATKITLVKAAAYNSSTERVTISCNCSKQNCGNNRCICYKNNAKCTIYCHADDDHPCTNKSDVRHRTTVQLRRSKRRKL